MIQPSTLRIALASPPNLPTIEERLDLTDRWLADAAGQNVAVVCFPEVWIPGLRGQGFPVPPPDQARQEAALETTRASAGRHGVAVVVGMEWETALGPHNVAFVISREGEVQGYQAKNQIPLEEAPWYVPDGQRRLFEIDGVTIGTTVCHEGWRYPEATRWSATRGAKIVFHPQLTGSDRTGPNLRTFGQPDAPYYEKAMVMRAVENTVWFASVNYALAHQDSATALIDPEGVVVAWQPYGEAGLLIQDVDLTRATGLIASRYDPTQYPNHPTL